MANTAAWAKLQEHYDKSMMAAQMTDMFASDPNRFSNFSTSFADILLDYSKNIVTEETMKLLEELCSEAKVPEMAKKMFSGEKINHTEGRAVLHVALRNRASTPHADPHEPCHAHAHRDRENPGEDCPGPRPRVERVPLCYDP